MDISPLFMSAPSFVGNARKMIGPGKKSTLYRAKSSKYKPHQGKRECERRLRTIGKNK